MNVLPQEQPQNQIVTRSSAIATQVLKGLGQIMLQENAITGLLFLVGIFLGSVPMGLGALLATISGTATAILLRYDQAETNQGLYGFSAALVGVAALLFFQPVALTWLLVIVGSALATMLQHFFIKRKIPVFTLPFVLVTWAIILLAKTLLPQLFVAAAPAQAPAIDHLYFAIRGFGQVIFQGGVFAGLLFFIGVFISSPTAALYGLVAALCASLVAPLFAIPVEAVGMGLWGYNAVLCAIVFAGPQVRDGLWVLLAVTIAFFIQLAMVPYGLAPLTFPFVAGSCITVLLRQKLIKAS